LNQVRRFCDIYMLVNQVLHVGTSGGLFRTRWWNYGLHAR